MCVIVDNNEAGRLVSGHRDLQPVMDWLVSGGSLVVGGKLTMELAGNLKMTQFLRTLKQAGRLRDFAITEADIESLPPHCSDDPHVLALARVSRTRVLVSRDAALSTDFTNPALIDDPRGHVYQGTSGTSGTPNAHVLAHTAGCPARR